MKSLLDIQQDIKELEKDMQSLTQKINRISSDIEQLRNTDRNTEFDYAKIELLARQLPFGKHPLHNLEDGYSCKLYLQLLLNIIWLDNASPKVTVDRLIFIQWLQIQSDIDLSLEDLLKDGSTLTVDAYREFASFIPELYKHYFLTDALMIANIGGTANHEIFEYIAELSAILKIDRNQLRSLAANARTTLCNDGNEIKYQSDIVPSTHTPVFTNPLKNLLNQHTFNRVIVLKQPTSVLAFKWEINHLQYVKTGDVIAICRTSSQFGPIRIRTNESGIIFQLCENNHYYGVISSPNDSVIEIRKWIIVNHK